MSAPPAIDGAAPALRAPASFLGLPTGDLEDLVPGDIALVGLFLDHGDNRGFGARFAARQIRYASRPAFGMGARAPEVTGRPRGRLLDLGDLNVFPLEPPRQREALLRQFTALLSSGARFVVVGGSADLDGIAIEAARLADGARDLRPLTLPGAGASDARTPAQADLFVTVDLAPALDPAAGRGARSRLIEAVGALPACRVRAAHLTGLAAELDVSARAETAFASRVLEALAGLLWRAEAPCH